MAEGFGRIMKAGTRVLFAMLGGVAGYQMAQFVLKQGWWPGVSMSHVIAVNLIFIGSLSLAGFILTSYFIKGLGFIASIDRNPADDRRLEAEHPKGLFVCNTAAARREIIPGSFI